MKLGKKPASKPKSTDLHFSKYRIFAPIQLPPFPPDGFGKITMPNNAPWGMLGNDSVGDCVIAWAMHCLMLQAIEVGRVITFSTESALQTYAEATGYDPNASLDVNGQNPTDQGTALSSFMDFWKNTGILDDAGNRHKIEAYVRVNQANLQEVREAAFLFKMPGLGIQFPDSAATQNQLGETWVVVPGAQIEGCHMIGYQAWNDIINNMNTWGGNQPAADSFLLTYGDECFAPISSEMLDEKGTDVDGFDMATLLADAKAVSF